MRLMKLGVIALFLMMSLIGSSTSHAQGWTLTPLVQTSSPLVPVWPPPSGVKVTILPDHVSISILFGTASYWVSESAAATLTYNGPVPGPTYNLIVTGIIQGSANTQGGGAAASAISTNLAPLFSDSTNVHPSYSDSFDSAFAYLANTTASYGITANLIAACNNAGSQASAMFNLQ